MRFLVTCVTQVACVGPQDVDTHAHPRRDEVPQIPLVEPDRVAVKVAAVERRRAGYARAAITTHRQVGALKVVAEQDRSGCRRRPGQPALGTPQKQIVTDQEYLRLSFGLCPFAGVAAMPVPRSSDRCQSYIDRKVYGPTFHTKPGPCWIVRPSPTELAPVVNSVCLPARALVWMRYWLQPFASRAVIRVTEPCAILEG